MIDKIIRDYLNGNLDVPVYMERPEVVPSSYLLLERLGTSELNKVRTVRLAVKVIGDNLYDTVVLSETVLSEMERAMGLDTVSDIKLENSYNFTDSRTKEYRWQNIFSITYYR